MPAYDIAQIDITDHDGYQAYLAGFMPIFERHGGKLLATSRQALQVWEGEWSAPGAVIMQFPSKQAAEAWHDDPEYRELAKIRHATARTNLVLIDGV